MCIFSRVHFFNGNTEILFYLVQILLRPCHLGIKTSLGSSVVCGATKLLSVPLSFVVLHVVYGATKLLLVPLSFVVLHVVCGATFFISCSSLCFFRLWKQWWIDNEGLLKRKSIFIGFHDLGPVWHPLEQPSPPTSYPPFLLIPTSPCGCFSFPVSSYSFSLK